MAELEFELSMSTSESVFFSLCYVAFLFLNHGLCSLVLLSVPIQKFIVTQSGDLRPYQFIQIQNSNGLLDIGAVTYQILLSLIIFILKVFAFCHIILVSLPL